MASGLLCLRTTAVVGIGLGLSFSLPSSPFRAPAVQCQYAAPYHRAGPSEGHWTMGPQDPLLRKQSTTTRESGILTASNMRQVSLGSVLGLVVGVGLRAFSRVLVVLFGMGIVAIEWAASKGYNVLPVRRLRKYVKSLNLEKAVARNVPFKISFGAAMVLAAFAQF